MIAKLSWHQDCVLVKVKTTKMLREVADNAHSVGGCDSSGQAGWRSGEALSTLKLTGVKKSFGAIDALNGVDLEVEAGEFAVLLGPSASGKTTTLRCIAGIEQPDAGQIWFNDDNVTETPIQGRDMAMVFQTFALYPHLSIRENLAYPLREQGIDRSTIDRRVDEIAEKLRLKHTLSRKPATASGGEQQRVAIGRALIREPKLLLLDEPLTNLDAKLRHDTRAEFKRLHRELGMTILYATPDELEALTMGQQISALKDGQIVQTGTPGDLYRRPDDAFVATLVGSPKMNMVAAELATHGGAIRLPFLDIDDGPWSEALRGFRNDTALLFGVRPQDLRPLNGDASGPTFDADVHLREPLGDITVLDLIANGIPLRMVLPEEQALAYTVGDRIGLTMRLENCHLFTLDTGTAIR